MHTGQSDIGAHAAIGDGRSVALVSMTGCIDWLCWPQFDSPALFAALIDDQRGGHFMIAPTSSSMVHRAYVPDSNVLVTTFSTASGTITITDLMVVNDEVACRRGTTPEHQLIRRVRGESGEVEVGIRYDPRPAFGAHKADLRDAGPLGWRLDDGRHLFTLLTNAPLFAHADGGLVGVHTVHAGDVFDFSLTYDASAPAVLIPLGPPIDDAIARTIGFWQRWAAATKYRGRWRDEVVRSALAIKLLAFGPSGAVVAAPTTSLPERIGGDLNWDYRYCWLRDAAFTTRALYDLGHEDDAGAFCAWLVHATRVTLPRVDVLYDVHGRRTKLERELTEFGGHRGSRPVRVGNAASGQLQLDVYGEVIDAVAQLAVETGELDRQARKLLRELGRFVCAHWSEPDQGIWEPRIAPQHYTHSKVLCWRALDRLIDLHRRGLLDRVPIDRFVATIAHIRQDTETLGFNEELQSYTQIFEGDTVDASLLLLSWYGLHTPDHPRMRSTFDRIRERLEVGQGLYYRDETSAVVGEGAFGICGFWVAEYLARGGGSLEAACTQFESMLVHANDVGLFGEETDPRTGATLGNFPQAYTHVGLISAALSIDARACASADTRPAREPAIAADAFQGGAG